MATKLNQTKQKAIADKQERKLRYNDLCGKLNVFLYILLGACGVTLALYFTQFVFVDNSDVGREVGVSGWSFFLATISGSFSSASKVFGDIAVPFYIYAKSFTVLAGVFTILSVVAFLSLIVLTTVILVKKQYWLSIFTLIASALAFLSLLVTTIICFAVSSADVLPIYCQGNPKCSIGSDAIYPLLLSLAILGLSVVVQIKHAKAERILHSKRTKEGK